MFCNCLGGGRLRAANSGLPPTDADMMTRVIATHPPVELVDQRDDHTRVWEIVGEVETTHPDGSTSVDTVKSYIHEKASGLCYKDATGHYVPAVAEWRETPDGFVIDRCAYGLAIGKKIGAGMGYNVEGHELALRPAYLRVSDGVNEADLAVFNPDAEGFIVDGKPSVVRFPAAFGPGYDLEYVAEKGGFHQNLIIAAPPQLPAGLDLGSATVHLYTQMNLDEYLAASGCEVSIEGQAVDTSRADFISPASRGGSISFRLAGRDPGELGRRLHAFGVSKVTDSLTAGGIPRETLAEKRLMKDPSGGTAYLVESVPSSFFLEDSPAYPVVWDYVKVSSDITSNATWDGDTTYWVSTSISVTATLTIEEGAVVKLNGPNGGFVQITIDEGGKVDAQGQPGKYIVFTKAKDDDYGDKIEPPPEEEQPREGQYGSALCLWSGSESTSRIRYCKMFYGVGPINCLQSQDYAFEHNIIDGKGDATMLFGIHVQFGASADCLNNLIYDSDWVGIKYYEAGAGRISNNTIYGANAGIQIQYSDCDVITDNLLTNCSICGISLDSASSNNVETLDYNGYWDCTTAVAGHDVGTNAKTLQDCPYAGYRQFFLEQYCDLVNGGSRTASAAGLSNHTTSAGTNSSGGWTDAGDVDIGYHYPHLALKPYVQKLETYQDGEETKAKATIVVHTTSTGTVYVSYGDRPGYGEMASRDSGPFFGELFYVYHVTLDDLAPDTLCHYRVRQGSNYSDDNTFYTTKTQGDSFRFLGYGDNRGGNETTFREDHFKVVNRMLTHTWTLEGSQDAPRPMFVLHGADFVNKGDREAQWRPQFFHPGAGLLGGTPLWPSLGNHEYNGDSDASNYRDLFSVPLVPEPGQEYWYSFDYGGCHFTVLDTRYRSADPNPDAWFEENSDQHNWLKSDLEGSGATWKFVLLHVPPYTHSNSHEYDDGDVRAVREQLAEKVFNKSQYGVDAVFCGHNHFYEHSFNFYDGSETEGVHCIVTGGGGADGNHNPWYQWDPQDPPNPARHCADPDSPLNYFHYLTVDVPGGAGNPLVKQWRHRDGLPPEHVETVTVGKPPTGW